MGELTKKFVVLMQNTEGLCVDLNDAAARLQVQKRRIYDITNVLEGTTLLTVRHRTDREGHQEHDQMEGDRKYPR